MRARIRGTEIFFDVEGASLVPDGDRMREKPTAFLIHGGPGADHTGYKETCTPLAERMQLVYFDHRGQGRSSKTDAQKYHLDDNVEDLEALREHLGLESIVSIGTSYGGMVAMAHAARYPKSVSHLVLIVTAAHSGLVKRAQEIAAERGTAEQIKQCENLFAGRLDTPEKVLRFDEVMGPLYSHKYDRALARVGRARGIVCADALRQAWGPGGFLRDFDLRPELGWIAAPTLILAARHDWISAPEFSEEIHGGIPGSDLRVFEESGHAIFADEPQGVLDAISGFVVYERRL